jgi:predicted AlkP superfamily phosphohydrolase/phosphomutase
MIFEEKTTNSAWFSVCISRYYDFFKINYASKILKSSNFDLIIPTETPSMDRKRFEMIMLMFNEWHFSIFDTLTIPTEIDLVSTLMITDNAEQPFHLQVKVAGHTAKKHILNKKITKLRQPRIQIQTAYNTSNDTHSFIAHF